MKQKRFYRSEEGLSYGGRIMLNRNTKDIFVRFPISIDSKSQIGHNTVFNRVDKLEEVDDRIKHISAMAEQRYMEQRQKEIDYVQELNRKRQRDSILIPHLVNTIKKQNYLNMRNKCNKTPLKSTKMHNDRYLEKSQNKNYNSFRLDTPIPMNKTHSNTAEKYLQYTDGIPLTRDFIIPTQLIKQVETKKRGKLRLYSEPKKRLIEETPTTRTYFIPRSPDSAIKERSREERIAQMCAKLVTNAKYKLTKGNVESAFDDLQQAIKDGIKHADVFYMFGEVNRLMGDYNESIKYLTKAMRFKLHSPYTYFSLGKAYSSLKNYKKAVKVFEHFLDLIETPEGHYELAKVLMELNDNTVSSIHITRAIELDPNCSQYYAYRGEMYESQGFLDLANKDYKKTLEIDPNYLDKYYEQYKELQSSRNYPMASKLKTYINKFLKCL